MTPFALKFREYRDKKGLSLTEAARRLGVSAAYLSQLENGRRGRPSAVMLDRICALFGLIWDDAEEMKTLARHSRLKVVIDTAALGVEATRTANLMAEILPRIDEEEAARMGKFLAERAKTL